MKICLLAPAAAVLIVAGCGTGPDAANEAGNGGAANDAAAPAPAPQSVPATVNAQQAQRAAVTLAPVGLALVDTATGSSRMIAFGTPQQETLDRVTAVLGPPGERADNGECPAGALHIATWPGRIAANFQDGRFVGWAAEDGSELSTASGIALGSTRAELERAYQSNVQEGSLGWEFGAGELYGVLSGPEPNARIDALWAGTNCIFS